MNRRRTRQKIDLHETADKILIVCPVAKQGNGKQEIIFIIADEIENFQIALMWIFSQSPA